MNSSSRWDRPPGSGIVAHALTALIPGVGMFERSRGSALLVAGLGGAVLAGLLTAVLADWISPVVGLALVPLWHLSLLFLPPRLGSRAGSNPAAILVPGLLYLLPAIVCASVLMPSWRIVTINNPASVPLLLPGEVLACRLSGAMPERGELVLVDRAREGEDQWFGRIVGLPGEQVTVTRGRFEVDGAAAVVSTMEVETESSYLAAWPPMVVRIFHFRDAVIEQFAPLAAPEMIPGDQRLTLGKDQFYVFGINQVFASDIDSRSQGAVALEDLAVPSCRILCSGERQSRMGQPVP